MFDRDRPAHHLLWGRAIGSNGALVYDLHAGRVVQEHPIPVPALTEAARRLRAAAPGIGPAVEYAHELAGDELYEAGDWDADITVQRLDAAEPLGRAAPKLIGRHPSLSADELLALEDGVARTVERLFPER
ncbi:hypothetical protein [Streptacidiphilus sp. P02-A3a]|uniref:hypothetical protein n=1 Tax=Streptacidiphilus sp. P02-A3a TaxID=2704468 RepID=UPI0015FB4C08|nr:hypothetical protein [Streptacidiphilus sp. P02-A3a]QMU69423.1 hypothetical protein GXP74_15420 [Streptacidiphilus sp. P02-A3a]